MTEESLSSALRAVADAIERLAKGNEEMAQALKYIAQMSGQEPGQ